MLAGRIKPKIARIFLCENSKDVDKEGSLVTAVGDLGKVDNLVLTMTTPEEVLVLTTPPSPTFSSVSSLSAWTWYLLLEALLIYFLETAKIVLL